jgi:hypothetical protein
LTDFVALYRGRTVSEAELVAVSAEPQLVKRFFEELLARPQPDDKAGDGERRALVLEVVRDD